MGKKTAEKKAHAKASSDKKEKKVKAPKAKAPKPEKAAVVPIVVPEAQKAGKKSRPTRIIQKGMFDSYFRKWAKKDHHVRLDNDVISIFNANAEKLLTNLAAAIGTSLCQTGKRKTATHKDGIYGVLTVLGPRTDLEKQVLEHEIAAIRSFEASKTD